MSALRLRAVLWFALALMIAASCARDFSKGNAIQTNLLALLPQTERNALAEKAVNHLAEANGNRAVFLIGHESADTAKLAAHDFAAALRASQAFQSIQAEVPPFDATQVSALYLGHRFNLLSDADRASLSAGTMTLEALEVRLTQKLYAPFRFGISTPLALDPLGLAENWLNALPLQGFKLEPEDGWLRTRPVGGSATAHIFLSAALRGSAYDSDVQAGSMRAIAVAEQSVREKFPGIEILRTGTLFYADAAKQRAELEIDVIGIGSVLGMLLMMYWVFRSPRPLFLGVLSVAFGIGAAITITIAIHDQLHLITLVFGASLIGEAIDYSIQYFAAHLGAGAEWEPMRGLKMVLPGLSIALATSLVGYGALSFAPFPALKQIALFALIGLGAAYLSVILLLPALMRSPSRRNAYEATAAAERVLAGWKRHMNVRRCVLLIGLCVLVSLPGWFMLQANDDIRVLIDRPAPLVAQEERIRDLTGFDSASQFFLIEGDTADVVLINEERLRERLQPLIEQRVLSGSRSLSAFVPSAELQAANRALVQKTVLADQQALRTMFDRAGLREEIATQWIADFERAKDQRLDLAQWLETPLSIPFRVLWLGSNAQGYASVVLPQGLRHPEVLAQFKLPGITWVDKASSVSELFRSYRSGGATWLAGGFALILVLLSLRYGPQRAAILLIPAALGVALALAFFGYAHIPLTLFNLMALMLVVGVGVNYTIFLVEGGDRQPATWTGVLLSAGTLLLSFGLLAFSAMPALSGFGLTLLIGIGIAVVLSPMVLTLSAREALA